MMLRRMRFVPLKWQRSAKSKKDLYPCVRKSNYHLSAFGIGIDSKFDHTCRDSHRTWGPRCLCAEKKASGVAKAVSEDARMQDQEPTKDNLEDAAASAAEAQPTGTTFETTKVLTKVCSCNDRCIEFPKHVLWLSLLPAKYFSWPQGTYNLDQT